MNNVFTLWTLIVSFINKNGFNLRQMVIILMYFNEIECIFIIVYI